MPARETVEKNGTDVSPCVRRWLCAGSTTASDIFRQGSRTPARSTEFLVPSSYVDDIEPLNPKRSEAD